jgi:hypothetical protein
MSGRYRMSFLFATLPLFTDTFYSTVSNKQEDLKNDGSVTRMSIKVIFAQLGALDLASVNGRRC